MYFRSRMSPEDPHVKCLVPRVILLKHDRTFIG